MSVAPELFVTGLSQDVVRDFLSNTTNAPVFAQVQYNAQHEQYPIPSYGSIESAEKDAYLRKCIDARVVPATSARFSYDRQFQDYVMEQRYGSTAAVTNTAYYRDFWEIVSSGRFRIHELVYSTGTDVPEEGFKGLRTIEEHADGKDSPYALYRGSLWLSRRANQIGEGFEPISSLHFEPDGKLKLVQRECNADEGHQYDMQHAYQSWFKRMSGKHGLGYFEAAVTEA